MFTRQQVWVLNASCLYILCLTSFNWRNFNPRKKSPKLPPLRLNKKLNPHTPRHTL